MESRYVKDAGSRLKVKFVKIESNEIILEVPITPMEIQDFMKPDYINSVMRNTFGQERLQGIGDIIVLIDQQFNHVFA